MLSNSLRFQVNSNLEFMDMIAAVAPVGGCLHPCEGNALMLMAEEGPGLGEIVELGSFKGLSTCWLATGSKLAGREPVTAIDHFLGSPEHQEGQTHEDTDVVDEGSTFPIFQENIRRLRLEHHVKPIVGSTDEAARDWNRPIRLLFIDAGHDYESVARDFYLWSPHVINNGLVAFHDFGLWEGVTRFCNELAESSDDYEKTLAVLSLLVFEKKAKS